MIDLAVPVLLLLGSADPGVPPRLAQAFANSHSELACDYTRTRQRPDERQVERFEENGGQPRWTLLSIDGEPPSKRRLKKYAGQVEQRAARQHPARVDFKGLAEPGSYRLLEEGAGRAVYEFRPLAEDEDDAKIVSSLSGRLIVDEAMPHVAAFELTNVESFSPAAAVTIHDMKQRIEFAPLGSGGAIVSRRIEVRTEGRLLGFKKISDSELITFEDFDCR